MKTLIDLPDPVHHTNLPIKNICALDFFEEVIANLRRTLTYFSHSDDAVNILLEVRLEMDIGRGLQSVGTTRFATITISAVSMRRCLPALREVRTTGRIVIEVSIISPLVYTRVLIPSHCLQGNKPSVHQEHASKSLIRDTAQPTHRRHPTICKSHCMPRVHTVHCC